MSLRKPKFLENIASANYFCVQAGHREIAVDHAILVIRESTVREAEDLANDTLISEIAVPLGEWVVETMIQGAWMREYHEWEKATKSYFASQHKLSGGKAPTWRERIIGIEGAPSHVDRIRTQIAHFNALAPEAGLVMIADQLKKINSAKHDGEMDSMATEADYKTLQLAIINFWSELAIQEEFKL